MFSDFDSYKVKRRGFWSTFGSVLGGIALTLGCEFFITLFCVALISVNSRIITAEMEMLISLFCTMGAVLGVFLTLKIQKTSNPEVGVILNKRTLGEYIIGAFIGLLMLMLSILPGFICGQASFCLNALFASKFCLWFLFGLGFIIQSFSEEYLCRGLIMKRLNERHNIWVTLFIQALIFMLMHSGNPGMGLIPYINLFLIGCIFGQVVIITDNLLLASGLHWLWNFAQGCIFGIKVSGLEGMTSILTCEMSGNELLTGGAFGIEGALTTTIVSAIVSIILMPKMKTIIQEKSHKINPEEEK